MYQELKAPGKINSVIKALPGPQRLSEPSIYAAHTPTDQQGQEHFDCFSTSCFQDRAQALLGIRWLFKKIRPVSGTVIEAERGVGFMVNGCEQWIELDSATPFSSAEVGHDCLPTAAFEVHHAIDIEVTGAHFPALDEVLLRLERAGVVFGGLFAFLKAPRLIALRTAAFFDAQNVKSIARGEHAAVVELARELSTPQDVVTVRTFTEQILGIWGNFEETK